MKHSNSRHDLVSLSAIILHQFLAFAEVLYAELGVGGAAVVVFHYRIADIDRVAGLDVVEEVGHVERYCRDVMVRMRLLDEFEFEMAAFCTDLASHSIVVDILRQEDRSTVAGSERLELLQDTQELRRDL